jgi:site-specific DNA-cytosine methylase
MAALVGYLAELRYGWAYRILDARHFGVPQRRRRVFIVALDLERGLTADRAAEVLSVGTRCDRHPATGQPKGSNAADGIGAGISRALSTSQERIDADTESFVVRPPPDAGGDRAPDGLAGRVDDRGELVNALAPVGGGPDDNDAQAGHLVNTLRVGPQRPQDGGPGDTVPIVTASGIADDPLLPLGLDSHRYRCCGNGVVAPVAEFVGERLAAVFS